ncbi:MAG: hypothetical protein HC880_09895 [Bacteroidia bacterium]|nr:hypothetical protein [Bacteroidia bacterium]
MIQKATFLLVVLGLIILGQSPESPAQTPQDESPYPEQILIEDQGTIRLMEVAWDEFYLKNQRRSVLSLKSSGKINDLKAFYDLIEKEYPGAALVLYPAGYPHEKAYARILSPRILIQTSPQRDVSALADSLAATWQPATPGSNHLYLLDFAHPLRVLKTLDGLRQISGVIKAEPLLARHRVSRNAPNDPNIQQQWHLNNNLSATGIDLNVRPVWGEPYGAGYLGRGIRVGLVDSGLDTQHSDLAENVDTTLDYDFNEK